MYRSFRIRMFHINKSKTCLIHSKNLFIRNLTTYVRKFKSVNIGIKIFSSFNILADDFEKCGILDTSKKDTHDL